MGTTGWGLEVGTDDADAIAALDDFTDRLAGIDPGVEAVLEAATRHPGVAALQLGGAMLFLYGQTAEASASAADYLQAARTLEAAMVERERATLVALDRWAAGEFLAAVETFEALLERWPRDLLALKALEFLYYVLGQQHMGPRFLATVERLADADPANAEDADVLAAWAFASELSGKPDEAIELAERSLAVDPHTPWAHHALAHAFITQGDPPEALARLRSFLPVWRTSGRVIECHNAWHLAVAHLDGLDLAAAEVVYRDLVWGVAPDTPGEQIDAISYLWRVEMAGWEVDEARWADVADHVEGRVTECVFPFLSAHHGFVLARAGRTEALATLRATVERRTAADDAEARRVWQPVGRTVVEACIAHGGGDRAGAAELLDPVMPMMTAVGGSDAQDDLFRQAYLTGLIAAGRSDDARNQWTAMTRWKTPSALDRRFEATLPSRQR